MTDDVVIKPVYEQALQLYDAMKKQSTNGRYSGSITKTYRDLGLANGNYTAITRLLLGVGAITCEQRGARNIESIYKVDERPTLEELSSVTLTTRPKADTVLYEQRLADLDKRIGRLDIVKALANLESRVSKLENERGTNA